MASGGSLSGTTPSMRPLVRARTQALMVALGCLQRDQSISHIGLLSSSLTSFVSSSLS